MNDGDCVDLLRWALPRLGMRWKGFRKVRGQVCKRIGRRMAELRLDGVGSYRTRLEEDPAEWRALDTLCRITISRFRRDRGVWEYLRHTVIPALVTGTAWDERHIPPEAGGAGAGDPGARLRELGAWSAGCGSGEEPYTLSVLWHLALARAFPATDLRIVATDAEPAVLERAREGRYDPGTLKELPERWIEEAFERADGELVLRPRFREPVELLRQDLREEMPDGPFHLVLCRNLAFTYFVEELQVEILERILRHMAPGGALVIGAHEELPPGDRFLERIHPSHPVYRRSPSGPSLHRV